MCGIGAISDFSKAIPDDGALDRMMEAVVHRGPDSKGTFVDDSEHVRLGVRRLSIVDKQGGDMPIVRNGSGKRFAAILNGEIFNHESIRLELSEKHVFSTNSDTEVLLAAYMEWGDLCVEKLRGQFAFLIYDGIRQRLFMARDRYGIKPLYYTIAGSTFLASSEPKGILAHGFVRFKPDQTAAASYMLSVLSLGKSEPLDRSFFDNIRALEPGTFAIFDAGGLRFTQYYDIRFNRRKGTESDLVQTLRKEVQRAVSDQIPTDVPYGIAFSGGLDSSIIATIASQSGTVPRALAVLHYAGDQNNADYEYAQEIASERRWELLSKPITSHELAGSIDRVLCALDRPFDSVRELGLWSVYKALSDAGCTVVLTGEGADEFNLGYYHTLPGFLEGRDALERGGIRQLLSERIRDAAQFFEPEFIDEDLMREVIERESNLYYEMCASTDQLDKIEYFYAKKFLKGRLDIHDRISMAHSIETRVPFCDEGVVDAALQVPSMLNVSDEMEKRVLRKAFEKDLPPKIAWRRKSALQESSDVQLYSLLLSSFKTEIEAADGAWRFLSRTHALDLYASGLYAVSKAKKDGTHDLHKPTRLEHPLQFRIRHLFFALVFLRWFKIYSGERSSLARHGEGNCI